MYGAELVSGPEAAEALRANLANDHLAVAAGDALRLFTSAFVTTSVRQLGVTLLCLFTVGAELESLLGSGFFWALLCLSVTAGGFADAALSPQVRARRARDAPGPAVVCWGGLGRAPTLPRPPPGPLTPPPRPHATPGPLTPAPT
jgi:membrane associated rhomboid family serine protease